MKHKMGSKTGSKLGVKSGSIGRKLLLVMALICLVPLITIGITANVQTKNKLTEKLSSMSEEALSFISENLDEYFKSLQQIVDISSQSDYLQHLDEKEQVEHTIALFTSIKEAKPDVDVIYVGTLDNRIYTVPHLDFPSNYKPTEREWYKAAVNRKNQSVISKPYLDPISGKSVVTISRGVYKQDKLVGVVAADFSLETISSQVSSKKIGRTGYLFMFDENGVLVSHPDSSLLGKNIADINVEFTNNIKNREEGFIRYQGKQGKEHFGAFTTNLSTGWTICTSINTSELDDDTHFIRVTTIFIILIMALISIGVAVFISTDISGAIHKVTSSFDTAAQGDLTVRVGRHRRDEFGKLTEGLDQMLDNVSSLLESVIKSADSVMNTSTNLAVNAGEVSTAVEDITKSVTELSQGAVSQAEDAQNGLIEMEKVSNQLDYITENSEKIHAIFTYTKKLSETGFKTIDTLTEKSEDAKNATNEVSRVVDDMYNSSLQISNISDALASITAQTNLLSLNAGIEAARAGDAGRGFSVVANEIRKLAEESKVSTEEIKVIIEGIQNKASQVAESIKVTGDVVKAQDVAVANTKEIFDKILTSITEMSEKVADISVAIRQTGENKNKLLKIIHNVSSVSQESAAATQELTASTEEINANVEEFAGYAEELKQLSDDLHSEIHKFQI